MYVVVCCDPFVCSSSRFVCPLMLQWSVITLNRLAKLWASPWRLNFSMVRQNLMVEAFGRGKVVFCLFLLLSQDIVNSPLSPLLFL